MDPATGWVYVANRVSNTVSVINGTDLVASVAVSYGPWETLVDPANGLIYVIDSTSSNVSVIDGTTLVATLAVGYAPGGYTGQDGAALDPVNGYVYVVNFGSDNVSVINGTSLVGSIPVGGTPMGLAVDPSDGYVYVGNHASDNVSVILGTSSIGSIPLAGDPVAVAFDPVDGLVYVASENWSSGSPLGIVFVIDGTNVRSSFDIGEGPWGIAVDPVYGSVAVTNAGSDTLSVIQGNSEVEVATGVIPTSLAIDPVNGYTYVANWESANVSVISGSLVVGSIRVGSLPADVMFDPLNGWVYVLNEDSGTATVLDGARAYPTVVSFHASPSSVKRGSATALLVNVTGSSNEWRFAYSGLPANCTSADSPNLTCTPTSPAGLFRIQVNASNSEGISTAVATVLSVLDANITSFPVEFVAQGLAVGVRWFAALDGVWADATGSDIWFSAPNGTHDFQVVPVPPMIPDPSSGSVTVNGTAVTESIRFSAPATFVVTIAETGLASGTVWGVDLNGSSGASAASTVSFRVPNGTYAFEVAVPLGYNASPTAGTITVNGSDRSVSVVFQAVSTPLSVNFSYQIEFASCLLDGGVTNFVVLDARALGGVEPYSYSWRTPTGTSSGPLVNTTTTFGGNLTVTLTVQDAANHSASRDAQLTMQLPPCPPPSPRGSPAPSATNSSDAPVILVLTAGLLGGVVVAIWSGRRGRGGTPGPS